jgi:hypothetical protein
VKIPAAEIVELATLLESVAGALIATIGITAAFAIGIRVLVRASERWRNGNVVIGVGIVASDSPLG